MMRREWQAYCVRRVHTDTYVVAQLQASLGIGSWNPSEVLNQRQRVKGVSGLTGEVMGQCDWQTTTWHVGRHGDRAENEQMQNGGEGGGMHEILRWVRATVLLHRRGG